MNALLVNEDGALIVTETDAPIIAAIFASELSDYETWSAHYRRLIASRTSARTVSRRTSFSQIVKSTNQEGVGF